MIRQFPKDHDEKLSENFWLREFHCRCKYADCRVTYISEDLIEAAQALRDLAGPLEVLSGFRCKKHNFDVKGQVHSQHLLGIAADFTSKMKTPSELRRAAQRVLGFSQGGIGLYTWGIHGDVRGIPARWIG